MYLSLLYLLMCSVLCMCVCVHVGGCVGVSLCAYAGERLRLSVFHSYSSFQLMKCG